MCKYVKCWCVADDSSEYKRQVYTKSGGYSLNYGTDPPKWRAGAILCNKERYCSYMSSNLPLSFHWPYISPRRVASMNFCRRLWKSSGSFLFIWIVSMRTLRYNSGNELKFSKGDLPVLRLPISLALSQILWRGIERDQPPSFCQEVPSFCISLYSAPTI